MSHEAKNIKGKYSILKITDQPEIDTDNITLDSPYRILQVRNLTPTTYVLRFDKHELNYTAGQHLTLGIPGDNQVREYSIYSPETESYLEVLIKEVDKGTVSKRLHALGQGNILKVEGPFGFFTIKEENRQNGKFLFVATGTGIAPFHSIVGTYPDLNYKILHGVRTADEGYEKDFYKKDRHILCTSRDNRGDFQGRVTDYLKKNKIDSDTMVYLCGNCDMIYEVYDLLTSQGLPSDNIKTEVYF
jgi:ferredoxin/flavodoxin---NADP+ reductase